MVAPRAEYATPVGNARLRAALWGFVGISACLALAYGAACLSAPDGASFMTGPPADVLRAWGAKVDASVSAGEWERVVVAVLLHVDATHLASNLIWTALLGAMCGWLVGLPRAAAAWILGGVGGQLASYLVRAGTSVGASGAIYGLAGLLAVAVWRRRGSLAPQLRWRALATVGVLLAALLLGPLTLEGVDHAAHVGGIVVGLAVGATPQTRRVDRRLAWSGALLLVTAVVIRAVRWSAGA